MSDNNRIPFLQPDPEKSTQVKIDMSSEPGIVTMTFEPGVVRMRMGPREARALAMGLLQRAEWAENPPPPPPKILPIQG
jgi:hypothetical protein